MSTQATSPSKRSAARGNGLADPATMTPSPNAVVDSREVERLAYSYWHARGCPDGSPEEDWLRAEQDLNGAAGK